MIDLTEKKEKRKREWPVITRLKRREECTYCSEINEEKKREYLRWEKLIEDKYLERKEVEISL